MISAFAVKEFDIPFFGVYNACASFVEELIISASIINNKEINYKKAIIIRFIESLIASIIYLLFSYIATSLLP